MRSTTIKLNHEVTYYFYDIKQTIEKMGIVENELFKNHFILTQLHLEEETYFFDRIYIMLTNILY